ncbi:hypothetical protein PsorP6_007431 [Peronosclerospora sorghi]|uniref:Uncharacterized protein n=1 Tax=Peronosclerospora sorghi TaxID=230839 RepID=A0ACC0W840_9STRA|nr:hypothetical protein PsorP6_007431 [Peronosclerospora sorghi]
MLRSSLVELESSISKQLAVKMLSLGTKRRGGGGRRGVEAVVGAGERVGGEAVQEAQRSEIRVIGDAVGSRCNSKLSLPFDQFPYCVWNNLRDSVESWIRSTYAHLAASSNTSVVNINAIPMMPFYLPKW